MQQVRKVSENVEELVADSPSLVPYRDVIFRLDRLLTPPSPPMLLPGLRQFRSLQATLTWALPLVAELEAETLDHLIELMAAVPEMQVDVMNAAELRDDFPVWATIIDHVPARDSYTCLHGLLVLVAGGSEKKTLRRKLASAIRGAKRLQDGANETLFDILKDVPYASRPEQYFELLLDHRYRLAHAKPALYELLISEIPELLGWNLPEQSSDFDGLDWTPPTPVLLPPSLPGEPWEPVEEDQGGDEYFPAPIDLAKPIGTLRAAVISLLQRIHGGNPLLLPEHISSLRTEEARHLFDWLDRYTANIGTGSDHRMVTGAVILATMLVTGRTAPRAAAILETVLSQDAEEDRPTLDLKSGRLVQPILIPKSAYCADGESGSSLLPTTQIVRLPLPPRFLKMIGRWKSLASPPSPLAHWKAIYPVLGKLRNDTNLDYTEGRIRHTLSCHSCDHSGDPIQSIWITANDARHSLAPAHYCVVSHSDLTNTYMKATWPIFQPLDSVPVHSSKIFVGAQTCPTDEFISDGLKKLTARLHNPTRGRGGVEALAKIHNTLVDHIVTLLIVLTGHRPNSAVFELGRWNFDFQLGIAIYHDKKSDPAHFYCPVSLGRILTNQLIVYERHLDTLRNTLTDREGSGAAVKRTDEALTGEAPLFFHLDSNLQPSTPSLSEWKKLFASCFPNVPPNVGRSFVARKMRTSEKGRAEYAYLQLGHYSIIGYPYIASGPTAIVDMANTLEPIMDDIVKGTLGRIRIVKGLYNGRWTPKPLQVRSPYFGIRSWEEERREKEAAVLAHRERLREARKLQNKTLVPAAEARFHRRLESINPKLERAIREHSEDQRLPKEGVKYSLTPEDINQLLSESSDSDQASNKELDAANIIALRNFTHRALWRARRSRYYSGPLPGAEIRMPSRFRTEFLPRMLAAEETMRRLRNDLYEFAPREIPAAAVDEGVTAGEWNYAYLAAVLIVYGGVTHLSRLNGLLRPQCQVERHPRSSDAILVQYSTDPPHVWALWRTAAVVYLEMRERLSINPPSQGQISKALKILLPAHLQTHGKNDLLDCFLDTSKVAQLTSLSGTARASLDPDTGSWSLPLRRQLAWLSNTVDCSEPTQIVISEESQSEKKPMPRAKQLREVYMELRSRIPRRNRDVVDDDGSITIPHETHRRHRKKVRRIIRDVISRSELPDIGRAMGDWLCQMLNRQKSDGRYVLSESTIYNYFTIVGSGLIKVLPERGSVDLDADEYTDLYAALLENKPSKTRKVTGRELRNLHALLVRTYGAPELDWSELADYLVDMPGRVDAQAVLSHEADRALMTLKHWSTHQEGSQHGDRRLLHQAYLVLLLLTITGCRISEITGLRHRDIYQLFDRIYIRIRPNYERGTKSAAAKRIIEIGSVLNDAEEQFLLNWLKAEKRRMGRSWKMTLPMFVDAETNRAVDRDLLRKYIQMALRESTQCHLISHHIRHALGGRIQLDAGLQQQTVLGGVRMDWPLDYVLNEERTMLLPRQTRRNQILIGHASDLTTNRSYGHTPWVYLHYRALEWQKGFDQGKAAIAVGRSAAAFRKMASRHGESMWESGTCQRFPDTSSVFSM